MTDLIRGDTISQTGWRDRFRIENAAHLRFRMIKSGAFPFQIHLDHPVLRRPEIGILFNWLFRPSVDPSGGGAPN